MKHVTLALCAFLTMRTLSGCAGGYDAVSTLPPMNAPSATVATATPPTTWTAAGADVLMYSVDEVLNEMFIYTPTAGGSGLPSTNGTYRVDMTSGCATSFNSGGSINALGTYTQNSNTSGSFNLSLNFVNCPMKGQDGSTYTINGQNFVVNGDVFTSTSAVDGTVLDVYRCPTIAGNTNITDPNGFSVGCQVAVSNDVTYAWNANLTITGNFDGTVCGKSFAGMIAHSLPVVAP